MNDVLYILYTYCLDENLEPSAIFIWPGVTPHDNELKQFLTQHLAEFN